VNFLKITGKLAKIGSQKRSEISKKTKALPAIGRSMAGGAAIAALEVATSFPGRCLGAMRSEDDVRKMKKREFFSEKSRKL